VAISYINGDNPDSPVDCIESLTCYYLISIAVIYANMLKIVACKQFI
jgi:hypothetical protein